ncbi:MAG: hypothetical protein Q8J97_13890 [Flavobacteriaceae bacterium]|nr:hypothetical protein [Flavobacteriaceae bacterium]
MNYQRLISAGKVSQEKEHKAKELLKNVQRLLKPIKVINPYVLSITRLFTPLQA